MYASIALNIAVPRTFDYLVPPEMETDLRRGHLVQVPFKTSAQPAIIMSFTETTDIPQVKPLGERLHPDPVLSEVQLDLAQWMSEIYLAPIGLCVWFMLPANMDAQRDIQVMLLQDDGGSDALEREIVVLLKQRGTLKGKQLDLALIGKHWRAAVDSLAQQGIVRKSHVLTMPRARPKMIQTAALAIPPATINDALIDLSRRSYQADLLELVAHSPQPLNADDARKRSGASKTHLDKLITGGALAQASDGTLSTTLNDDDLRQQLNTLRRIDTPARVLRLLARERKAMDVSWVYAQADTNAATLKRMEAHDLIVLGEKEVWRDPLAGREFVLTNAPRLTPDQAAAWAQIQPALASYKAETFLLQGVTGSGKTEVYLRAIEAVLAQGRDAIFLVPEIALTAQTVRRVAARFPGLVAVYHSGLTDGERYDTWRRARAGMFRVVVGARSALFTPLPDVGLLILDEEHDSSYKQSGEQHPPQYHARAAAEEIARLNNAVVILGSATPALETRYRAELGEIKHLRLSSRILGHRDQIHEQEARAKLLTQYRPADTTEVLTIDLPPVEVVDMRQELKAGNTSIFSRSLQTALRETLSRHEQALLLMNRRGQASYVFCRDCGYVAQCPRCDTPLTHHRMGEALRCHRCGYEQPTPQQCPQCSSTRIKFFGAGTQQVEEAVKTLLPQAHVLRWDADSATTPGAHEAILKHFIDRYADLIVGTQMIAKGLDLPLVTLVGVISADISLNLPDFRAAERTFQLLTQMAGRAGRGLIGGKVILQTYQPQHYAIQAASQHDSDGFYARELSYRRELGYPPFRRMVRITFVYPQETRAREEAHRAATIMNERIRQLDLSGTALIGPAPCFFQRVNGQHRWQLILRGPDPTPALRGMDIPQGWHVDVDPLDLL